MARTKEFYLTQKIETNYSYFNRSGKILDWKNLKYCSINIKWDGDGLQ